MGRSGTPSQGTLGGHTAKSRSLVRLPQWESLAFLSGSLKQALDRGLGQVHSLYGGGASKASRSWEEKPGRGEAMRAS